MTFPMNYKASVSLGLTLMDTFARYRPKWRAKDIIVLFYDDAVDRPAGESYSKAVKEFLELYYLGHDYNSNDYNLDDLLNEEK